MPIAMCGRYALHSHPHVVALQFGLAHEPAFSPRYNISPGTPALVVRADATHARRAALLQWGLIPSWAKEPSIGHHLINARAEHVADKPAFRSAFRHRRCIVPANGFYEWKATGGHRQPYYVRPLEQELFGLAGLFEHWQGPTGLVGTCTIITTQANSMMAPIHDRMPAILSIEDYAHWLDPDHPDPSSLLRALRPHACAKMLAYPVNPRVNSVKHDDARLVEPCTAGSSNGDELF